MRNTVHDCRFIELPTFPDHRGKLAFVQNDRVHLEFDFCRLYFLFDVPFGGQRAGHAHRALFQLFFAFSGAYDLHLDDGANIRSVRIEQPNRPFFVRPNIWRVVDGFTSGAVCAVLASQLYDEADYIRDYDQFSEYVRTL
ncbi:WxcM-like domain-containing protein [Ensifer sp. ENS09]|uniref:sugar 3,4-ketoisomerase n=1 Tax=Ensifer sp. ENS09 TaxID=2769263 RepID=UPI00177A8899|nr:WxcM-like domain-containing protein [Ensifer sp. ENS09]